MLKNQVYTGKYRFENGELKTIEEIKVVKKDELIEEISQSEDEFILEESCFYIQR